MASGSRAKRSSEESRSSTRCSTHSSRSYASRTATPRGKPVALGHVYDLSHLASTGHWDQGLRHAHHVGQLASTGRWDLGRHHVYRVGQLASTRHWALVDGSARAATSRCWTHRYYPNKKFFPKDLFAVLSCPASLHWCFSSKMTLTCHLPPCAMLSVRCIIHVLQTSGTL